MELTNSPIPVMGLAYSYRNVLCIRFNALELRSCAFDTSCRQGVARTTTKTYVLGSHGPQDRDWERCAPEFIQ